MLTRKNKQLPNLISLLLISGVSFLTLYKTLGFYFWFDDFSTFYNVRSGGCTFDWPFNSYCTLFKLPYSLFGLNPFLYFSLALVLRIIFGYSFYLFLNNFSGKKVSLILSLILISLVGFDSMMAFYSISSGLALSLLFFSLNLLLRLKNNRWLFLVGATTLFLISLGYLPIYSTAHIFPVAFILIWIFLKKNINKRVFICSLFIFLLITVWSYLYIPFKQTGNALLILERSSTTDISKKFISNFIDKYLVTTSYFIWPEIIDNQKYSTLRPVIGFLLNIFLFAVIYKLRKNKNSLFIGLFSLLMIVSQYLPRGFVTNYGFGNHDRHFYYPYVGIVLFLSIFKYRRKFPMLILSLMAIFNIVQSNVFLGKYAEVNRKRANFYNKIGSIFSGADLSRKIVIFFDAPPGEKHAEFADFIRVGMLPEESSIAVKIGTKVESLEILGSSEQLINFLKDNNLKDFNFYSFYYDGSNISETTRIFLDLYQNYQYTYRKLSKYDQTKYLFDKNDNIWLGKNTDIDFSIDNKFVGIAPLDLKLSILISPDDYPLPYKSNDNKNGVSVDISRYSQFIILSDDVKKNSTVKASNHDADTLGKYLSDGMYETRWNADRALWFEGIKPEIVVTFNTPQKIDGFFITSTTKSRKPKKIEVYGEGQKIKCNLNDIGIEVIKIVCDAGVYKKMVLKIADTYGDNPSVDEIDFIPQGFSDIDFNEATVFKNNPFYRVKNEHEKEFLNKLVNSGVDICLKWENPSYGKGEVPFSVKVDGFKHKYFLNIPTTGMGETRYSLGCIKYPVRITFDDVGVRVVD